MSLESPSLPHGPHPSGGPVAGHADDASKAILYRAVPLQDRFSAHR